MKIYELGLNRVLKFCKVNGWLPQVVSLVAMMIVWTSAMAIDKQTVTSLTDQDLVLTGPLELHITSATMPFSNSTVSLNHEDAWVFFDNIRPSDVVANHLASVKVNGAAVVLGTNARMAIYLHGTVIMPHGSSFSPLTVYKDANLLGESMNMGLHTYYNTLGAFDNTIKSFKLKRGYQATLATSADGKGYSRVFIADNNDLEVSAMPGLLEGTVSFIRVFKHQWVTKKGWCGWSADEIQMIKGTWYYDWNVGGSTSDNVEYALIKQKGDWPSWDAINNKQNVSQLLGYNEPDRPDQSNLTFDFALSQWPEYMKSGLRLGAPATSDPFNSWSLYNFVDKCDQLGYRLDFVAIHAYWGGMNAQTWYNRLKAIHDRTKRPIWITEWNNGANWTTESWPTDWTAQQTKQLNDIKAILNVLDTCRFIERYSIYNWVEDKRAMILNGALTPAGEYYAANKSQVAFHRSKEVIPTYVYTSPVLSYTHYYTATLNQIKLAWTDGNGELSKGYKLERRINEGAYETIYESTNVSVTTYSDNIQADISGRISYKLSLLTSLGTYKVSNEVAYFQGAADGDVQAANLLVNNADWSMCIFSKRYSASPLVYLGIQSTNNGSPMTNRVRTITTRSFYFHLDPWAYLNNPTLASTDKMAFMALPTGVYNFGGLKAAANSIASVNGTWQSVTFTEAFDVEPVVFCTQTTNSNTFPTAIGVRNVTTTGFEVCLMKEEAITALFQTDKVNYFAIVPGTGAMGNRRITVGKTVGKEVGGTFSPVTINLDETYTQPALFAGLLTASDAITSNLRYYSSGTNRVNVLKMRETSSSSTAMAKDQMGWMVMDLASGQPTSVGKNVDAKTIAFFPNPVTDILYLSLEKPTRVTVYDLLGRKYLDTTVTYGLDVASLPRGTFVLMVDGAKPIRFIKN
jgi:hypothetical protein